MIIVPPLKNYTSGIVIKSSALIFKRTENSVRHMPGWMGRWMDKGMDEWTKGRWLGGWTNGWTDGWLAGWINL